MAANVRRLATLIRTRGRRHSSTRARARPPGWRWAPAEACRHPVRHHLSRRLFRRFGAQEPATIRSWRGATASSPIRDYTARHHRRTLSVRAPSRIVTIHRGVDLAAFAPDAVTARSASAPCAKAWGVPPDQRIVLLPARLARRKGHRVLIEAAKHPAGGRPDATLVFILRRRRAGREPLPREIDRAGDQPASTDHVRRVGHCADMPAASAVAAGGRGGLDRARGVRPHRGRGAGDGRAGGGLRRSAPRPKRSARRRGRRDSEITGCGVPAGDPAALADAIDRVLRLAAADRDALSRRASGWARGTSRDELFDRHARWRCTGRWSAQARGRRRRR